MRSLITGSAGHLGEALVRTLRQAGRDVVGLDLIETPFTDVVGSIVSRDLVRACLRGVDTVFHTATLHKPHVATHTRQDFVDTNITGTLNLLEEAVAAGVRSFVFTSTTSAFGDALVPEEGAPAAWITEGVASVPKNIYGATKTAAEDLCQLFHRNQGLTCIILRTSRFFPEEDDNRAMREAYSSDNAKANEYPHRRVELSDVVSAHLCAAERGTSIGFGRYIISATTPFTPEDLAELRTDAPSVLRRRVPSFGAVYERLGWTMFPKIDRVYDNAAARADLGWTPQYDFAQIIDLLATGKDPRSPLTRAIGVKGYHEETFEDGPFPVE